MSSDLCLKCGSKCCKYFCFQIDEPESYDEFEDVRWYLCHEGVSVHIDEGTWFISIMNVCRMLEDNGECRIYEDRPLICRKYDQANCDHTQGDYGYDELFETPESLDAYARKTLGKSAYERVKAKERAKLEPKKPKSKKKRKPGKKDKGKGKKGSSKGKGKKKSK